MSRGRKLGRYPDKERKILLRQLGYPNYDRYLRSELWQLIRKKIIRRDKGLCRRCGGFGAHVHHTSYDRETLLGEDLRKMFYVCEPCHEEIHFTGFVTDTTFAEATAHLI